jgi:hypothetical protein
MIKATGLWVNESKDGKTTYFGGSLGGAKVLIYRNTFKKEGSNEPDYNLYFAEHVKKPNPGGEGGDGGSPDIPF